MKIVVTNISRADISIDIIGENKVEDHTILHPKNSRPFDVTPAIYAVLKSTKGLVINMAKGAK